MHNISGKFSLNFSLLPLPCQPNSYININYLMKHDKKMKLLTPFVVVSLLNATFSILPTGVAGGQNQQQGLIKKQENIKEQQNELRCESRKVLTKQDLESNQLMQSMSRAIKIIGSPVKSLKGDDLGEISDLVLDPETGQVAYVVVSFGGRSGRGVKLFAIPWKALYWGGNKVHYVLDFDTAILTSSPGFNAKHWPDSSNKRDIQCEALNQFYYNKP